MMVDGRGRRVEVITLLNAGRTRAWIRVTSRNGYLLGYCATVEEALDLVDVETLIELPGERSLGQRPARAA